jgi:kynurenine formamidase
MPTADCTQSLGDAFVYPGDPPVSIDPHATVDADGYRVRRLALGTHAGTHVDAPAHTEPDGRTVDEIPVERFRFDTALLHLDRPPRAPVGVDRLRTADPPADADLLALRFDWSDRLGTPTYRDHPFLTPDAAAWCADRNYDIGLDTPNPDPTPPVGGWDESATDPGVPAHHELLGSGRVIVENLVLSAVPERFELRAVPLSIPDGDAAAVRAVAEW